MLVFSSRWLQTFLRLTTAAAFLAIAPGIAAKCASGTVGVQGKVENLDSVGNLQVLVIVQTAKYTYSQAGPVTNSQFDVIVPFSRRGSYSRLWGEHCSDAKIVEIELKDGEKVVVRRKLKISADFEPNGVLSYTLKRQLILDLAAQSKG